jgi:hypothetical protein
VRGILADINLVGHLLLLLGRINNGEWRDLWAALGLIVFTFQRLGLDLTISDADLWQVCQQQQIVLITANRNAQGPDSLEATIRARNTPASLPVLTLANAQRVLQDSHYADLVIARLLEYLIDIDNVRGTGRLFLP